MASSSVFVFADNTTAAYQYYEAGSTLNPYTMSTNKNSADVLGYVLRVLSLNQSRIYDRLSNMGGGADLTTVNSYITAIDSKLGVIRDSLGIGSSLENVLSNQTSNLQHLNTIINKLSYWDNSHGRSYDLSEMIFNIMDINSNLVENTSSVPAISIDTGVISSNTSSILSKLTNYTGVATKYNTKGVWNTTLTSYDIPAKYSPYITIAANNNPRVLFSNMNNAQPLDFLEIINKNIVQTANLIHTNYTAYPIIQDDNQGGVTFSTNYNYSLMDALYNINSMMGSELSAIKYMIADPATIAAKKANASQEQTVLNNYTGNGSASASASDFVDIKDSVDSVKTGLNTNVSVSNIFNIFNNNDGYGFWSDDTRNELNSTGSNRNNLKTRGVSDTPLYDAKISELYNAMGVNHE